MSTYDDILKVAYDNFSLLGYEKTSLNLIAKEVGISKPALYYHFKSKESLFEILYDKIISDLLESFDYSFKNWTQEDYFLNLKQLGIDNIVVLRKDIPLGNILKQYTILSLRDENLREKTKHLEYESFRYFKNIILHGCNLNIFKFSDENNISNILYNQISGISYRIISNPDYPYEENWIFFMDVLLKYKTEDDRLGI